MDTQEALSSFDLDPRLFYDAVAYSTDDYLYIIDMRTDMALVSENMLRDFDLPDRLFEGLIPRWRDLVLERDRPSFDESIDDLLSGKTDEHDLEYQVVNRKGEHVWIVCRGLLMRDDQGEPVLFSGAITNLERKGKVDAITGLFMHEKCLQVLDRLLARNRMEGGILLLGLDDFSRINSLNDHAFGNGVLRQFAQSTLRLLPDNATAFRFDGDEFAIVLDDGDRNAMEDLYRTVHAFANRQQDIDGVPYFCTVSGGIAMIGEDGATGLDLVKHAESALEESKHHGKNTVSFFSPAMSKEKLRRLELSDRLQASVMDGMKGFSVHYQPLVEADTLRIAGAEALLRWSTEEFGSVSPVEFIPVLESYGLIGAVGRWVFEQAVRQCAAWNRVRPDFIMNVNISYLQMLEADFVPFVERTLAEADVDAQRIVLEMTESYFVTDLDALRTTFDRLRALGIRLAMDDFGTGYSSLGLLSQSPADIVKIDRLFIKNIHAESFNRAFIDAVIDLCHSVDIEVTVEGVEESTELDAVRAIGADNVQGFLVSRPLSADAFEERFLGPDGSQS
ncbi:putative bifunctional diguanylate cyclase/phosphodiesterase [Gordonibacter massiliensis (ex Traore et al. 2017)]|uniref:putative bifunctional diguanylate cyclase/phosphodiesterase n=1 Tax=Gordonibacter massiliensis (ex Traore et al. 2017) TaxID=1841863 RepID=UPI001C8BB55C|nr:GGDEF and EAL domain-containing protein [Gordonibacter massiliensis (ex Traore et al. 2017)]MBX9034018.1 EAL domain-containing protein [Gordonibacter massiliensis (ex Traore et al. 2017)]